MKRVGENVLSKIKWVCKVLVRRKKHGRLLEDLKIVQHGQVHAYGDEGQEQGGNGKR